MFHNEHNPPHFHVKYNEYRALISINTLSVITGELPPRALGLTVEWAMSHRRELLEQWQKAVDHQEFDRIEPLR